MTAGAPATAGPGRAGRPGSRAARAATEARGETFYPGASRMHLARSRPRSAGTTGSSCRRSAWPAREERHYLLVPTTCFNCESACGLLAYVDRDTAAGPQVRGEPGASGITRTQLREGPGHAEPGHRPRPDPVPAAPRRASAGEGKWERVSWDEALDAIAARHPHARSRGAPQRDHVPRRPAGRGRVHRARPGRWGVDGHNSHTNVCSSGGRAGYHFWMGIDRPSPDHANAKVIYLISSHLESGHYFNPHAQRIIEARENGAKLIVLDTRLSNTATHADYWLSPAAGQRSRHLPGHRQPPHPDRPVRRRVRPPLVELGGLSDRSCRPDLPVDIRDVRACAGAVCTASSRSSTRPPNRARRRHARRGRRGRRRRRNPLFRTLALGGRGQPGRLAGVADAVPDRRAARRRRHRGRDLPERLEQVRAPARSTCRRIRRVWKRPDLAGGVPAGAQRAVASCCRTSSRTGAASWTPTSPASTTRSGPIPTACPGSRC